MNIWALVWNLAAAVGGMGVIVLAAVVSLITNQDRWIFLIPGAALVVLGAVVWLAL